MNTKLIGKPDTFLLAKDLWSEGFTSCAEVEAAGFIMTPHKPTRAEVDYWLSVIQRHKDCCYKYHLALEEINQE